MSFRTLWRVSLCLATLAPATILTVQAAPPQFEESLEPLDPRHAATEQDEDRAQALTFFGMAHEAETRGDSAKALLWYLRALRYDPSHIPAARLAMRLAIQLRRPTQAVEAALKISDCKAEDRLPLRYVALHLTQQDRWEEAIRLYERTLGDSPQEPKSDEDAVMMMEMARLCHLIKDYEKAASYFSNVLKALETPRKHNISPKIKRDLMGEDGATYQLIGSSLLLAGDVEAAEAVFEKAQKAAPNTARAAFNAASIHRHAGRFEAALEELDLCLGSRPALKGLEPLLLLEETLKELGRSEELIDCLASLRRNQPENTTLGYFLAQKLFDAEQYDGAEEAYLALVEHSPTSTAYQHLLEIYLSRHQYKQAAGILATVVEKTGTLDALGESLEKLAGSTEAVDAIVSQARRQSADDEEPDPSHTLAAGLVALAAKRFTTANELLTSAIHLSPDRAESLLLIWGLDLLSAERTDEAIRVLRNGVEREGISDEQRGVFHYYLAAALELDGQTDAALEAAREAVRLSEDSALFHGRIAWILYHADRKSEAAVAYRAIVDRFDDNHESAQARDAVRQARMVLSTLCLKDRRIDEAVEWLEQVLDEYPEDPGALNDLGYLWADENMHLERAYQLIKRAVCAEPENGAYRDSLGWVLYRKGQYQKAIAELAKAVELEPDPVVLDHLGDAYLKTDQIDQAKSVWKQAALEFEQAGMDGKAANVRKKLADKE